MRISSFRQSSSFCYIKRAWGYQKPNSNILILQYTLYKAQLAIEDSQQTNCMLFKRQLFKFKYNCFTCYISSSEFTDISFKGNFYFSDVLFNLNALLYIELINFNHYFAIYYLRTVVRSLDEFSCKGLEGTYCMRS